jgi:PAS domain S-box-containing protein
MRQIITKDLASIYTDVPTLRPGTVGAYALSLASTGVATVVRLAIDPYVMGAECLPFFPAVIITALIGGREAGLFCVALSTAAVVFLQMPPLTLLLFVLLAIFLVILITRMRLAIQRELAAHALQASKDCLQSTLDAARLGSWRYDAHHRVFSWDARSKDIFGVPEDGATVEEFMNWVHPDDVEGVWAAYHKALAPAQPERSPTQFRLRRGDGKVRWVETNGLTYLEGAGREQQVVGFIGTVQDITARKSAEEAQARLAAIVTSSADAIVGKPLDGIVTSWNEAAERIFGYSAGEMIGESIRRLVPADRQLEEDVILTRMARTEAIERHEMTLLAKDGHTFDASITVSPIRDAEGRTIGCSKIIRDITERKWMEARLAEREAQLALFVEHAPAAIAMFDDKMRYVAVSRRFVSDFLLPAPAELIGRSHYEIFPDTPPRWREVHARVLAGEELAHEEDQFPRQDGPTHWVRWSMKLWRAADGRIGGALLFSEVITEQVAAKRALAESEVRFRTTFENAAVGIAHADPDGRWLRVNEALCRIVGYPVDELVTKTFQDITHPDDLAAEVAQVELMREGQIDSYDIDKRYLRKDGVIAWGRKTVGCVRKRDGSIDYFVSVVEDISTRKRAEELLRRQADLLSQSHDAIFTWKIGGGITYWSRGAEVLYGYTPEEAIGRSSHKLLCTHHPVPVQEIEAELARQGFWYGELTHTTREGHEIVVDSRRVGVVYDGQLYALETNRDVTERNRTEKQVRFLMREANHRVKNMLSLVQVIARQTAARGPEDFVDRFTERLQALAANQDLLVRHTWQGIDVEDLVRAQLAPFVDLIGPRIILRGRKLHLNAAATQAIGLTLHELATNASKYGALSADTGCVDIRWEVIDDDTFIMGWTEREGPAVSPPRRRGFGATVTEAMAKSSVGGSVDLDYAPSGVTWRLTCPAANALESGRG